jgi:methionine sulfoxide reductase heme-binding subunit
MAAPLRSGPLLARVELPLAFELWHCNRSLSFDGHDRWLPEGAKWRNNSAQRLGKTEPAPATQTALPRKLQIAGGGYLFTCSLPGGCDDLLLTEGARRHGLGVPRMEVDTTYGWWLASRASGLLALGLVTTSAALALMVTAGMIRRPGLSTLHQQLAVAAIVAIAVHGITLLGDPWLRPGIGGIAVPFTMAYRPLWSGLGIVAGYLAAIFGLSFYIRRRIGPRLWRSVHRLIIAVYALAVAHAVGAGTDASTVWLRWWLTLSVPVILVLYVARFVSPRRRRPRSRSVARPPPSSNRTGAV